MQRIAGELIGGRMAQGRDTARHILGLDQAAIGISLASAPYGDLGSSDGWVWVLRCGGIFILCVNLW